VKIEAVLFTKRRKFIPPIFRLGEVEVKMSRSLKSLGLWFDDKLSFWEQFRRIAKNANKKLEIPSALKTNLEKGPRKVIYWMYTNIAFFVLLYGM